MIKPRRDKWEKVLEGKEFNFTEYYKYEFQFKYENNDYSFYMSLGRGNVDEIYRMQVNPTEIFDAANHLVVIDKKSKKRFEYPYR